MYSEYKGQPLLNWNPVTGDSSGWAKNEQGKQKKCPGCHGYQQKTFFSNNA